MSWGDYTAYLKANNACEAAAILSGDDGSLVAGENFTISKYELEIPTDDDKGTRKVPVDEAALILEAFNSGKVANPAGMRMSNIKWQIVMADVETGVIYFKKEKGGACAIRTSKTIVIGTWHADQIIEGKNVPQNPGDCNKVVEGLGKILKDAGY